MKDDFEQIIIECVDSALREVLGNIVKDILILKLKKNYGLRMNEIPRNPEKFMDAVRGIFGDGSLAIERIMIRNLRSKVKVKGKRWVDIVHELEEISNSED